VDLVNVLLVQRELSGLLIEGNTILRFGKRTPGAAGAAWTSQSVQSSPTFCCTHQWSRIASSW
jgi:hypothetical protein